MINSIKNTFGNLSEDGMDPNFGYICHKYVAKLTVLSIFFTSEFHLFLGRIEKTLIYFRAWSNPMTSKILDRKIRNDLTRDWTIQHEAKRLVLDCLKFEQNEWIKNVQEEKTFLLERSWVEWWVKQKKGGLLIVA